MTDWKEAAINDYCVLNDTIDTYTQSIQDDTRIHALLEEEDNILKEINKVTEGRNHAIEEAKRKQDMIAMELKEKWDIAGKTYECVSGTVTLKTTKALNIDKKADLITSLMTIGKLPECIRTWNLSYLRKLKDLDLIEDTVAHYEEHQNVVIKGVSDK